MKTRKQLLRITSAGIMALLLFLPVFSCKKKDDTPEPTPAPPVPVQKDVFTDDNLRMMSDYEISNHRSLQAFGMYNSIKKGLGGPLQWFDEGFGLFTSIQNYENTVFENQQIANIDNSLGQVQTEIVQLQADFLNLITQLNYDKNLLMNEVYELNQITATAPIITAYSNADQNGFRWYSNQAKAHNSGSPQDVAWINSTLNPAIFSFAIQYTTGSNASTLQEAIVVLNGYLVPTSTSPGLLSVLSRNIVAQNKTATPLSQYMVLENYFLQIINYQFQAAVVQLNCFKITDTVSYRTFSNYMQNMIRSEVTLFLKATNFLSLSLYDYRNMAQYNNDVPDYMYTGIAPETNTRSMMARAQFVANLIAKACGASAPVMCGSIVLPHYYNAGTGSTPLGSFNVVVGGKTLTARTDTVIKSPFPYSLWQKGQPSFVYWDNQWNVFNYGNFGTADAGWTNGPQSIEILNAPWGNTKTPTGSITPKWYNPRNPGETSATETDSCNMQFAYFAASWKWGYLGPCLAPGNLRNTHTLNNADTWQDNGNPPSCPFVQQWHSNQHKFESSGGYYQVAYNNGCLFQESFSGAFGTYSSGWIYAYEFTAFPVSIPSDLGSGSSVFVKYAYLLTSGWASGFSKYIYEIGTGVKQPYGTDKGYESTGDIGNWSGGMTGHQTISNNGSSIVSVGTGSQELNFEIILGMEGLKSTTSFWSQTNIYAQYVCNGRFTNY